MDLYLKELCKEIINQNLNSEKFASLIIETGVKLDSHEWSIANKLLEKGDEINSHMRYTQYSVQ